MSQGIVSLHKILKDETRQKIILLLNQKRNLSYTDLMDNLEVVSTGLLNYHLKVLADLIAKNDSGQYTLTEKGQLAYKVLTEFSTTQPQVIDKRIYKSWIIFTIASVIIAFLNGYFFNIPLERVLAVVFIILATFGFAFYIRINPSKSGSRFFFVSTGVGLIGSVLTLFFMYFMNITRLSRNVNANFYLVIALVTFFILGGLIGDWIGKRRNYAIPMLRV
jgi:hypothetical protein